MFIDLLLPLYSIAVHLFKALSFRVFLHFLFISDNLLLVSKLDYTIL